MYFRVLLTPINAATYVTFGERTLYPSLWLGRSRCSLFSGQFPLSYKQDVYGLAPKESSLGLRCTSAHSWGSLFLRVLAGISS